MLNLVMVNKFLKDYLIVFIVLLLSGCTTQNQKPLGVNIVVSNWVGYAPLLYSYEKGDLAKLNIDITVTSSLQTSVLMYEKNRFDGICTTQAELKYLNDKNKESLTPIVVFNRSYGGDVILSNISPQELYGKKHEKINVFLEKNSVNEVVFNAFLKTKPLDTQYLIHYVDQYNITNINCSDTLYPKMLVTYEPYASKLKEKGFYLIESTKNDHILIFDFLSIKENSLNQSQIKQLQKILNGSIEKLQTNPKEVYDTVKFYFDEVSYEDFKSSIDEIQLFSKETKTKFLSLIDKEKVYDEVNYLKEQ